MVFLRNVRVSLSASGQAAVAVALVCAIAAVAIFGQTILGLGALVALAGCICLVRKS